MEPIEQLSYILPTLSMTVGHIVPSQLTDPTPCSKFTVEDLLDHLMVGGDMFAAEFRGEEATPNEHDAGLRSRAGRRLPGDDGRPPRRREVARRHGAHDLGPDRRDAGFDHGPFRGVRRVDARLGPRAGDRPALRTAAGRHRRRRRLRSQRPDASRCETATPSRTRPRRRRTPAGSSNSSRSAAARSERQQFSQPNTHPTPKDRSHACFQARHPRQDRRPRRRRPTASRLRCRLGRHRCRVLLARCRHRPGPAARRPRGRHVRRPHTGAT